MDPKVNLNKIEEFAQRELQKYKLHSWKFVWDTRARVRYGQCRYDKKEIGVSKSMAIINTLEESKNTVLHEIAHALAPGHKHNHVWKQKCLLVGAKPEQYYSSKVNRVEGKAQEKKRKKNEQKIQALQEESQALQEQIKELKTMLKYYLNKKK